MSRINLLYLAQLESMLSCFSLLFLFIVIYCFHYILISRKLPESQKDTVKAFLKTIPESNNTRNIFCLNYYILYFSLS
ncbi:hypothetical protein BGP_1082 [Beggiatoa sp. PS]|nr:hypothetical protein BGP_1082 [Beggiatoa sp. PS]